MHLLWTSWLTIAVLIMYFWTVMVVGRMRIRHKVKAPSMEGPPDFQRAVRVQTNTIEQLVFFLPALWLCAAWSGDVPAAILGLIWLLGRILYALAYLKEASKRSMGFMISTVAAVLLLLGAVIGLSGVLK